MTFHQFIQHSIENQLRRNALHPPQKAQNHDTITANILNINLHSIEYVQVALRLECLYNVIFFPYL